MTELKSYMNDGAGWQSRAILACLDGKIGDGIESSWDDERKRYRAEVEVSRWENCREQGYVVVLRDAKFSRQLNIAFFEHRNSDLVCAVEWEQRTINAPTIETAEFKNVYKDKWDVSHTEEYGKYVEMSEWIAGRLVAFWDATKATATT